MNVTLERSTPTEAALKIALTPEDYRPEVDKKIKDYSRKANLKGFRPGKVPPTLIQKLYGKSILVDQINDLLSKTVSGYIRENKLSVVGDPLPDRERTEAIDWDNQQEFEFVYNLGLASEFEVDFAKLPPVPAYEIQATDKELDSTLEDLKTRFGEPIHPETLEAGDMAYGTFEGAGLSEKSAIPTAKLTESSQALFVAKKVGDVVTFDIQSLFAEPKSLALATGKKEEEVAELQGEVTFTIEDITRSAPAEMNQEFFDKVLGPGKATSEEDFRAQVLAIIQDNYRREAQLLLRDDLQQMLLDNTKIDLPDEFLRHWLLETNEGKLTEADVEQDYDKFARDLRWTLIRNKVAESADIKVEPEEIEAYAGEIIKSQFGIYGDDSSMGDVIKRLAQGYLKEKNGDNYYQVFNRVYANKVMDVIVEKAQVETQPIDVDTFREKAGAA
jgi:trigger factor